MIDLPVPLTSFIGRERDQAAVCELLAGSRLVTLVGPGGCGKTRLALQVARDLTATGADTVHWVDLAPLADPALVAQTVAASLGIAEQPGIPLIQTLCEGLRARSILLILDNCEHLIAPCAYLTEQALQSCPHVRVLITSREALNVAGERIWPVAGLALPDAFLLPSLDGLLEYESVQLFVARAVAVQPTFAPVQGDILPLAHICLRLDGIPLAIELAAARMRVLSLAEIDERLADASRLLTGGSRKASPHQQTLRASLDWSYDLLTADERTCLRCLSTFTASWDLSAMEHVAEGVLDPSVDPLDLLARLIEKSLVLRLEGPGGARYRLQEVVRQYAWSRAVDLHEVEMLRARHRSWCLALVEQAASALVSPDPSGGLDRLEAAHDDIRAALRWSLIRNEGDFALDLAAPIWRFWLFRGYLSEGRGWLEEALAATDGATPSRAEAALGAGVLANFQADFARARELCELCIEYSTALADRRRVGFGLLTLANVKSETGDYEAAARTYEEALAALRDQHDHRATAMALGELSLALLYLGESDRAEEASQESVAMYLLTGNTQGRAGSLTDLAIILLARQEYARAYELCAESLAIRRALDDKGGCAHTLMVLAWVATAQRQLPQAVAACKESLAIREAMGDRKGIAQAFEGLAGVADITGDARGAVRLLAAANRLRAAAGSRPAPTERAEIERVTAHVRSCVGEVAFDMAWSEGTEIPPERILAEAHAFSVSADSTEAPQPLDSDSASTKTAKTTKAAQETDTFGLTAREREVLRLVTQGLTYGQMAEQLVISPRTVDTHLRSIYGKLDVTSRSAATRVALENHLV